jgi:lipopolysaccharide assembly outer membrane protein LptD (OstA)
MKRILMTGLSILLFGTLFVMLRNGSEIDGDLRIKSSSFIDGLRILHKKNGIDLWTLNAKRADFTEGGDKAQLSDINLVIQKEGLILYADRGTYDLTEQRFTTEGIVKAETKDYTITADSIDYKASLGEIKTGGRIKVEGKSFRVEGRGMKADAGQKVSVLNDVKATFNK